MAVVFGGGLVGVAAGGGASWLVFHSQQEVGLALTPWLLAGGICTCWAFSRNSGPEQGWDYYYCSD